MVLDRAWFEVKWLVASMCVGWKRMENYCSSGIIKVCRISWENSLSNERRKRVLENNVLARIYNSIYFSILPVYVPLVSYS